MIWPATGVLLGRTAIIVQQARLHRLNLDGENLKRASTLLNSRVKLDLATPACGDPAAGRSSRPNAPARPAPSRDGAVLAFALGRWKRAPAAGRYRRRPRPATHPRCMRRGAGAGQRSGRTTFSSAAATTGACCASDSTVRDGAGKSQSQVDRPSCGARATGGVAASIGQSALVVKAGEVRESCGLIPARCPPPRFQQGRPPHRLRPLWRRHGMEHRHVTCRRAAFAWRGSPVACA